VTGRIAEVDAQFAATTADVEARGDELRRARAGIRALSSYGSQADLTGLSALEDSVAQARARRQALAEERDALVHASILGLPPEDPHAHLRHRALPNVNPARTRTRALRVWSSVSASFLLAGLAVVILGHLGGLVPALGAVTLVMLSAEAFAQRHLARFLAGLVAVAAVAAVVWLAVWAAAGHWRSAVAALLILAAVVLLLANIRDFFIKR
jgi:ABC-type multidrug transport system fused ATPase/permease subunit